MNVVFAPHHSRPDPSDLYECLPIVGFAHRIAKKDYHGRREEVMGDHVMMFGFLLFRPRKTGFILCLN